jgi:hypothetical protein
MTAPDTTTRTMEEIAADPAMRFLAVRDHCSVVSLFAIRDTAKTSADARMMEFEGVAKGNGHKSRRLTGAEWLAAQRQLDEAILKEVNHG